MEYRDVQINCIFGKNTIYLHTHPYKVDNTILNHGYQEAVLFKDSHEEEELDHGKGDEHKSEFGQIECVVLVILNILLIENGDDQEKPRSA